MTKLHILVCGGGNGAHTLAGTASSLDNVDVNVMTLFSDEAERWTKALGSDAIHVDIVHNDGSQSVKNGKPNLITKDPKAAMEGVDAIFFVVPAFAHQQYFDAIAPYLKPNTTIVGMPGQAGFHFQALATLKNNAHLCAIISLESLPWATRIVEFGKATKILGVKDILGAAIIPGKGDYKMQPLALAQSIIGAKPNLVQTSNYLAVNLMADCVVHPPMMYGKWKDWDGKPLPEPPLFYQGVDDIQEEMLSLVSVEVGAIAAAIHNERNDLDMSDVIHIFDWYKKYYVDQIVDNSSLQKCMQTNKAYNGLIHPMKKVEGGYVPDFTYRYTSEDVPYGIVVIKGIAQCVGVKTPTIDKIIAWLQVKLGKEYIVGSELTGKDLNMTRAPQAYGFKNLTDIAQYL